MGTTIALRQDRWYANNLSPVMTANNYYNTSIDSTILIYWIIDKHLLYLCYHLYLNSHFQHYASTHFIAS